MHDIRKYDYVIISFLSNFQFPLREATRKQVWWEALKKKEEGYNLAVFIVDHSDVGRVVDGIAIEFLSPGELCKKKVKANHVHYLTGSIIPFLMTVLFIRAGNKILTLTDGFMFGADKYVMRRCISKVLPLLFNEVRVFCKYQQNLLGYGTVIKPHLPTIKKTNVSKSKNPSILYMGHISKAKGFDSIIPAIGRLLRENPSYKFVVANNMIEVSHEYMDKIQELIDTYPNQIETKGIVVPEEELTKCWVYIYPFIEPRGTMAFPLSLYESLQCGTPFVACNVGGNSEFFDAKYLIEPGNENQLYDKIVFFINERKNSTNI